MSTIWTNLIRRFIPTGITVNQTGIKVNQSGILVGGSNNPTTWTFINKS